MQLNLWGEPARPAREPSDVERLLELLAEEWPEGAPWHRDGATIHGMNAARVGLAPLMFSGLHLGRRWALADARMGLAVAVLEARSRTRLLADVLGDRTAWSWTRRGVDLAITSVGPTVAIAAARGDDGRVRAWLCVDGVDWPRPMIHGYATLVDLGLDRWLRLVGHTATRHELAAAARFLEAS